MRINYSTVANDKLASYRYRIQIPAEYLESQGHEVSIGKPERADVGIFSKHFNALDYDTARQPTRYRKVVFDVCDFHMDGQHRDHYERMMSVADLVVSSTEEMRFQLMTEGFKSVVIPDPYEFEEKPPEYGEGRAALWFGHASNLPALKFEINNGNLNDYWLQVISNPNSHVPVVPWSMEAMKKGLKECDVVIIPQQDTMKNRCKGANRMVEAIRSGRFVVASPMPAYKQFEEWMFLGDIREGLEWARENRVEIKDRIRAAQKYVRETFSPEVIGEKWELNLTSGVEVSC